MSQTSLVVQCIRICLSMRGHRFDPWSRKIPHAMEQLSPCTTTPEPTWEPVLHSKRRHCKEKPTHGSEDPAWLKSISVQFSRSVMSDSLRPHELQHARPPCPSPTPGAHSDSCPSSSWWHPAISSSVIPFSYCPQSLPASESFPMSQLFTWGGQSTGVSASASVPPMNTQDWSPLE